MEREFHYKKKLHCGKRVLLKEGSSIGENRFSYDKEVSMEKEFFLRRKLNGNSIVRLLLLCGKKEFYHEKEVWLWNRFHSKNKVLLRKIIIKRKFYFEKKALKGKGFL